MLRFVAGWLTLLIASLPLSAGQDHPALRVVPDAELLLELQSAPNDNPERVTRLVELYRQAGAVDDDIARAPVAARRPTDPPLDNVIVTKKGETDRLIVVGGHLDKVRPGGGIIDDWSGACMAANLYQAIRDVPTRHTFQFVGFAYEEQGLLGSRAMVVALGEEPEEKVRAMVNLECLGVGGPFLWTNGSNNSMEALAHQVADRVGLPLVDHEIKGVGADSIPFDRAGIPSLTFDGLPTDKFALIHSDNDRYENVDPDVYVTTYRLVTHYLLELDRAPDDAITPDPAPPVPPPSPTDTRP